jgi:hypothetical protein
LTSDGVHRLRSDGLSWREVDGEVIALDHQTAAYLSVNAAGRVLWRALAAGATTPQLVDLLVQEFGLEREPAKADVDAFLDAVARQGLLDERAS